VPILEENRGRYPASWPQISKRIRNDRAEGRCECEGECGTGHRARCPARQGQPHPITTARVQLTVAHLDHQPENCSDENLRAMCQRCHLSYDADHHAATRAARRARQEAEGIPPQLALFPVDSQGRVGQDLFENRSDL
jgi:hypothetical protein